MTDTVSNLMIAGVVLRDAEGRYLLVQEAQRHVYGLWNLPAGQVDKHETTQEAAVREAYEESGYKVKLKNQAPLCVDDSNGNTKHSYEAEIASGEIKFPKDEILNVKWVSYKEIKDLFKNNKLRSPWIIDSTDKVEKIHANTRH